MASKVGKRREPGEPARMSFDLDRDIHRRFNEAIPWGIRAHLLRKAVSLLLEATEKGGDAFLAGVLSGEIEFRVRPKIQDLNGSKNG